MKFAELIPNPNLVRGVKAVWGPTPAAVICFGTHGDTEAGRYSIPKRLARDSFAQPFVVALGGGKKVQAKIDGRAVEIFRMTGAYGNTEAFVTEPEARHRLAQWPVSVALSEVYDIQDHPRLIEDLGFSNMQILSLSFDSVTRFTDQVEHLWRALCDREVTLRTEISIDGFVPPTKVMMCGSIPPRVHARSTEGKKLWIQQLKAERDPAIVREAKEANRRRNGGDTLKCECCGFADELGALFDAHHKKPISIGVRVSTVDDFHILCPTCHRWAHQKSSDKLYPIPLPKLIATLRGKQDGASSI